MKQKILFTVLLLAVFAACQKEGSPTRNDDIAVQASKTTAAKNEAVNVNVANMPSGNNYTRWSASPSTGVTISNVYTGRTQGTAISFSQSGVYEVSADLRTVHPNCMPSPGFDTCYTSKQSIAKPVIRITVTN